MMAPAEAVGCDLLVAGSGAGGLAAAVAARALGLDVLVIEKAGTIGGTTAWSGGEIWVPANRWQREAGLADTPAAAELYLAAAAGQGGAAAAIAAYVRNADGAVGGLVDLGAMAVEPMLEAPDYDMALPGACAGGRTLRTLPFDGRALGPAFGRLRLPLPAGQILGGLSVGREDLGHFRDVLRSARSARHVASLVAAHLWHRASGLHRGARTTMGNAMIGRFMAWLAGNSVPVWTDSPLLALERDGERVRGGLVGTPAGTVRVAARLGVLLATGGFAHDPAAQRRHLPHVAAGQRHHPLPPPEVAGDGLRLALAAGGALRGRVTAPVAWTAVSRLGLAGGRADLVPHFGDRAKPGIIAVLDDGRRFVSEAADYHRFCAALVEACRGRPEATAHLVTDHPSLRRYGLGRVGAAPAPLGPALRRGYLVRGATAEALAEAAGIDAAGLVRTLGRWNAMVAAGRDSDFGRGETPFERASGDPGNRPNPCLGPILCPPFYAIRIHAGSLSSFLGLDTDPRGRVRDAAGRVVRGLYAVGADAESVAGGAYPAAGITLGPAITFGVLAARDMARSRASAMAGAAPPPRATTAAAPVAVT